MAKVIIRHKISDYDTWKGHFDNFSSVRQEAGETSFKLFRGVDDQNELLIIVEWDNIENAKAFFSREDLKEKMQEAGVIEMPEIHFVE